MANPHTISVSQWTSLGALNDKGDSAKCIKITGSEKRVRQIKIWVTFWVYYWVKFYPNKL